MLAQTTFSNTQCFRQLTEQCSGQEMLLGIQLLKELNVI